MILDLFRLDGKVAVITGAGRGIGAASAVALAECGADVVIASRTQSDLDAVAARVAAVGRRAITVAGDLADLDVLRSLATAAQSEFGRLDVVVNNVGGAIPLPFLDTTPEYLEEAFHFNVATAHALNLVAVPLMLEQGGGSIINISSQMGHVGAARRTVYCASKHAMEGFTKAMAIELAPHNIRVNSLGPTFLETPMTRPFFENKAFRDEVLGKIKLGRLGQLEELTGAIVFLASDASSLMTGSALVLDGGWTAE